MSSRRYVLAYLLLLSPLTLLILANYLFLRGSGEMLSANEVAARQAKAFSIYGTATNHNTYRYKLALYRDAKPRAVAVGSSRTMQFRSWFFDVPFMTMGGAMNSLREGEELVDDMLAIHRPDVVLLGVDFWWFDASVPQARDDHTVLGGELHLNKLLFPLGSLWERKFSPAYFAQSISSHAANACAGCDRLGLLAATYDEGYAPDGSRYYLGTLNGKRPSLDYRFETTLSRVASGAGAPKLAIPAVADPQRVLQLQGLIHDLRSHSIPVIVVLPPVAPTVLAEMRRQGSELRLGEQLRKALPDDVNLYDFTDPSSLNAADDCEFVDGTHGGDLMYLRMLAAMAEREPALRAVLRAESLRRVSGISGVAMLPGGPTPLDLHETDFLGLGCTKPGVAK